MAKKRPQPAPEPRTENPDGATPSWWRQLLHEPVALCLCVPIMLRPWLDGVTYPTDNFYFLWFIAAVFVVWSAGMLIRGTPIRFGRPILLLTAFLSVALLTGLNTIQVYATYRGVLMWSSYFFLFVLVTNGLRGPLGAHILLTACAVSFLFESAWSLLHLEYVLPYVRQLLNENPRVVLKYFNETEATPELAHRLNTNRAFGSLLFPNALGAFLILGIPFAATAGFESLRRLLRKRGTGEPDFEFSLSQRRAYSIAIGAAVLVMTAGLAFLGFRFLAVFAFADSSWTTHRAAFIVYVAAIPGLLSVACGACVHRYGPVRFGLLVRAVGLPLLLTCQLISLWYTYSRGAMLGLAGACIGVGLLWFGGVLRAKLAGAALKTAAIGLALVAACVVTDAWVRGAWAQNPPANAPAASSAPAGAAASKPVKDKVQQEGREFGVADLADTGSLRLRLSYWQTAWRMARAHWLTGVGLGNFRAAFPLYQLPGAAATKLAHNDYLQMWCETGIGGCFLFVAFWAYFAVWGARKLLDSAQAPKRWLLTGLYTGLVAFLLHSLVDFNFFNPSLAFYAFLLAGLFYYYASPAPADAVRRPGWQTLGIPMLLAAALASGMALRTYLPDYVLGEGKLFNVGDEKVRTAKFRAGAFFLKEVRANRPANDPAIEMVEALTPLIPQRSQLESFGQIWVPAGTAEQQKNQPLAANEAIPPNAFFAPTNPVLARETAIAAIQQWLRIVETADDIFPYSPEVAGQAVNWYGLLIEATGANPERKREFTLGYVKWAARGVERSPMEPWYHEWYAKGLWMQANLETGPSKMTLLRQGLGEFHRATELYPSAPLVFRQYADALTKFGNFLKTPEAGLSAEGDACLAQAEKATKRRMELLKILEQSPLR